MMDESFINIVNLLERATDAIYRAYELLYELEVDGEKNTSKYVMTLNLLHEAICVENDALNRLSETSMVEDALIYFGEKFNNKLLNSLFILIVHSLIPEPVILQVLRP